MLGESGSEERRDGDERVTGGCRGVHEVIRYLVDRRLGVEREVGRQRVGRYPGLSVGLEQLDVVVVGDLAAVLRGRHHVLERRPREGPLVEVLLEEGDARVEVTVVELVRHAPAEGAELAPLERVVVSGRCVVGVWWVGWNGAERSGTERNGAERSGTERKGATAGGTVGR